jgi:hypothetical protein
LNRFRESGDIQDWAIDADQYMCEGGVAQGRFGMIELFSGWATAREVVVKSFGHSNEMTAKAFRNEVKGSIILNDPYVVPIVGRVLATRTQGPKIVAEVLLFGSLNVQMGKKQRFEDSLILDDRYDDCDCWTYCLSEIHSFSSRHSSRFENIQHSVRQEMGNSDQRL